MDKPDNRDLGIALSGGGHRASLFGLGALLYLVDVGANKRVATISSVSGGSITSGFVAQGGDYGTVQSDVDNRIVATGHNRRVQNKSPVLHAEMDCLNNAGRLRAEEYRRAVLYSTPTQSNVERYLQHITSRCRGRATTSTSTSVRTSSVLTRESRLLVP